MTPALLFGLLPILVGLVLTTGVAVVVALLFGLRRRALAAVAYVSALTTTVFGTALVFAAPALLSLTLFRVRRIALLVFVIEAVLSFVEWRLLVWALGSTAGSSKRLLVMSVVMSLVSIAAVPLTLIAALFAPSFLRF